MKLSPLHCLVFPWFQHLHLWTKEGINTPETLTSQQPLFHDSNLRHVSKEYTTNWYQFHSLLVECHTLNKCCPPQYHTYPGTVWALTRLKCSVALKITFSNLRHHNIPNIPIPPTMVTFFLYPSCSSNSPDMVSWSDIWCMYFKPTEYACNITYDTKNAQSWCQQTHILNICGVPCTVDQKMSADQCTWNQLSQRIKQTSNFWNRKTTNDWVTTYNVGMMRTFVTWW